MKFVEKIDKNKYEEFVTNHKKSHFLQSYAWGQFAKDAKKMNPHYVGLVDDKDNLVATCLLLEKKLPLGYTYFYASRGYVIDFNNHELVKELTDNIASYVKKRKGIYFKIDPDIKLHTIDKDAKEIDGENNKEVVKYLKSIGFKHLPLTYYFESEQPRFTFRVDINKPIDEVRKNYSKTANRFIKKAEDYKVDVKTGTEKDIKAFSDLMIMTEKRQNFYSHDETYYKKFYKYFSENKNVDVMMATIDIKKTISKLENKIKELENAKEINEVTLNNKKEELAFFKERVNLDNPLISSYFTVYYGNKSWYLYGANDMDYKMTYANYKLFDYQISKAVEHKKEIFDEFGTIGDPTSTKKVAGLHEFKKKFGGEYTEFVGEFDYPTRKLTYFFFTKLVSIRRHIVKLKNRKSVSQ